MEGDGHSSVVIPLSTSTTSKKRRTRKKQRPSSTTAALSDNKLVSLLLGIGCFSFCITTILFVHLDRDNPIPNLDDYKITTSKIKFIPKETNVAAISSTSVNNNKQTQQKPKKKDIGISSDSDSDSDSASDSASASGNDDEKNNVVNSHIDSTEMDSSKEKLIQILVDSGLTITPEIEEKLPTWGEVKSLYGSKPRIVGLETCPNFQQNIPETDAYIGPSGIFNTGTNLLADLLLKYCTLPKRQPTERQIQQFNSEKRRMKTGMLWHVPWGKHNPISWRLKHKASLGSVGVNQENVLPVVVIKDPYHWMGSMCRHPYAASWQHSKNMCPNLLMRNRRREKKKLLTNKVTVEYRKTNPGHYESLVGLWNDWYGDYLAIEDFPRLIVRFEDLLFHLDEVMTQICNCGGGTLVNNEGGIKMQEKNAKAGHNNGSNGLLGAMLRYGHGEQRTDGFTEEEKTYAKKTLRKDMMDLFGYSHPTND